MRMHPAFAMLALWVSAVFFIFILPFQFTFRKIELEGVLTLALFISSFCFGSLLAAVKLPQQSVLSPRSLNFRAVDAFLKGASILASASFGIFLAGDSVYDLAAAFTLREQRAQAMIAGSLEESSIAFKIGFFLYPAAYVYIVRVLVMDDRPRWAAAFFFGAVPCVLAALSMGGRNPVLSLLCYGFFAYFVRRIVWRALQGSTSRRQHMPTRTLVAVTVLIGVSFVYFVNVFLVRADAVGGAAFMLEYAGTRWGVTFSGPGADVMVAVVGDVATYLVFVFLWYFLQGVVISNELFVSYDAGPMLGVYGSDLLTGLMRRISPESVASGFNYMLDLGTYGFLPSAFGTLYVDFLYGGLFFAFVWGWFAGLVYRRTRTGRDPRWFLVSPFVAVGIFFSLMNTPFGFNNGYMTHIWLLVAFVLIGKPRRGGIDVQG